MSRGDKAIRWGLVVSLATVTVIAVAISYVHLHDLATDNGEKGAAAAALPVTVDGLILACSLVIVNAARRRSRPPVLAWLMLLAGIGATLAGNVAHGIEHGWPGAVVAGWPAVVAAGCFHLVIAEVRRGRRDETQDEMAAFPEPVWWPLPDLGAAGEDVGGYALWETMEPVEPAAVTAGREMFPALTEMAATGAQTEDDPPSISAPDPGLDEAVATARDRFGETLSGGRVPSIRAIRKGMRVGYPRAKEIHERLTASAS